MNKYRIRYTITNPMNGEVYVHVNIVNDSSEMFAFINTLECSPFCAISSIRPED